MPDAAFQRTRWSLVCRARGEGPDAFRALSELCAAYHFPLYSYARRTGLEPPDAEDATQGFFAHLLEKDFFARADQNRGLLRNFLLGSFTRFLHGIHRARSAQKRGGDVPHECLAGPGDRMEARYRKEPADPHTPETHYQRAWARHVLAAALARTEAEWKAASPQRARAFPVFVPFLSGAWHTGTNFAEAAATLGVTPGHARQQASLLRRDYRRHLLQEIADTIADDSPAAIEEELRHFMRVLEG